MKEHKLQIKQLVKSYRAGEASALGCLMRLVSSDLYRLAYGYVRDAGIAQDIVADVFTKLIDRLHTIRNEDAVISFIKAMTVNRALDVLKKRNRDRLLDEQTLEGVAMKPPSADHDEYVRFIMTTLDDDQREVLLLWSYGHTLHEMVERSGLTINQVRLVLKKAQDNFKRMYELHKND